MAKTKKVDKPLTSKQKREILEKIEKKTHNQIELSLFYKANSQQYLEYIRIDPDA